MIQCALYYDKKCEEEAKFDILLSKEAISNSKNINESVRHIFLCEKCFKEEIEANPKRFYSYRRIGETKLIRINWSYLNIRGVK